MAFFEGIEYFDISANDQILLTNRLSLNDLMRFMQYSNFNTVQLDVNQERFLFYDPAGERYGLCDLHTLSSSTGITLKNVLLHQFDQTVIDDRVNQFKINNADFGIEISKKDDQTKSKKRKRRRSKKKTSSLENSSILETIDDDDDENKLNSSTTTGKFFSHYR